ncbi:hypothetical protein PR202_ga12380 [Eleusine coracana subsp. coracana]|uniref:Pollen Ole e 1 allergen and extensin family protein n=1 Tax=Eleusine coracana subsp. coracana TaxID=191504 RepID=A0AAV5CBL5_ELECO|nr:hypothetical protein PR202_ga12380 [Eleusine coracana subsp. coracana]
MLRKTALLIFLLFVVAAAKGEEALPMELYFSPAELARIAGYGEELVSSVTVSGQVTCELCIRPGADLLAFELPGAKVAVICESAGHNQVPNSAFAMTDEYGNFTIDLPSQLHATPNLEKACTVKVLQLPIDSSCRFLYRHRSTYGLRLSSQEDGIRTYTTGVIRLQHSDTSSDKCVNVENRIDNR